MTGGGFSNIVKIMKKVLAITAFLVYGLIALTGCAKIKSLIKPFGRSAASEAMFLPVYSGPKARVIVEDFAVKAAKANSEICSDLRRMLLETLSGSERFLLVDRKAQNTPSPESGDLIVSVSVSEFEPQVSGGRDGIGGGGGVASGTMGGLLGAALSKAQISLNIRLTDASLSKVLAETRIQGRAQEMEKATRSGIFETARYISEAVPQEYYKY